MATNFDVVASRLLQVLGMRTHSQLATRCGFSAAAWSARRQRDSLPTEAVDRLIEEEQLSPEFVYNGIGPPHIPLDENGWGAMLSKRLSQLLAVKIYGDALRALGHSKASIQAVAQGKLLPSLVMLRDMRSTNRTLDLNWLICGDVATAEQDDEREVINAYKRGTELEKAMVRRALNLPIAK